MKKSTLFCGIIGAAVAVVVMTLMMYNTPLAAYAQRGPLALDPNTYFAMDNDTAEAYIRDYLRVDQNSTAATLVREHQIMNEETEAWLKEYLISVIRNMSSIGVSINHHGMMVVTSEVPADYINDDVKMEIDDTPFSDSNGYKFELGKITAPNGTQLLPRSQ